jgi:hypothetical protein
MRGVAIVAMVAGCAGPSRSVALEHEPVRWAEPSTTVEPTYRKTRVYNFDDVYIGGKRPALDPVLADRLRKDGPTVLPPMVTGPLVVLDLDTQKIETHCGDIAKRIAHQIGTMLADSTRQNVVCQEGSDVLKDRGGIPEVRCYQLETNGTDVAVYLRSTQLVGVVIGTEYAGGTAAHDAQIAKAKCP